MEYWLEPAGTLFELDGCRWARYIPITWLYASGFDMSRSHVERMIRQGAVELDGRKLTHRHLFIQLDTGRVLDFGQNFRGRE